MSRPERHVDDITDMRRSCQLRENTSGRRPLGSSSRLLKVPNIIETFSIRFFIMGKGKPQTAKCHVTTALPSRSRLNRRKGFQR